MKYHNKQWYRLFICYVYLDSCFKTLSLDFRDYVIIVVIIYKTTEKKTGDAVFSSCLEKVICVWLSWRMRFEPPEHSRNVTAETADKFYELIEIFSNEFIRVINCENVKRPPNLGHFLFFFAYARLTISIFSFYCSIFFMEVLKIENRKNSFQRRKDKQNQNNQIVISNEVSIKEPSRLLKRSNKRISVAKEEQRHIVTDLNLVFIFFLPIWS